MQKTTTQKINITHFSNAHNGWLRSLDFYKTEVGILQNELNEIAGKNTNPDVQKQVEHFQNQFGIQARNIQDLANSIRNNVTNAAHEAKGPAGYVGGLFVEQHNKHAEEFTELEKVINELRHSFYRFATEWM
jgi:hypothetical protein